jgi:diguanylate cyclase (GGDEF)-like protein
MAGWVLANRQIITRQAIRDDYTLQRLAHEDPHLPEAIAPLAVGGEILGLLIVDDVAEDSQNFVRLLYVLSNIYALGIKNAQLFKRIEDMARRDGLTGLLNHATFQEALQELIAEAAAASTPVTVVMSDIDRFKQFNDTHGHQAGDHVLREVARLWKAVLPDYAVVARYGGEEFICALPHDGVERGRELAEVLRQTIAGHTVDFAGRELKVTSSFGVAELNAAAATPAELIKAADALLYRAKESGRNRVVAAGRLADAAEPAATM